MKNDEKELLLELLKVERTRGELSAYLSLDDATMRKEVSELSWKCPVISYSTKKGYRVIDVDKVLKTQDQDKINDEIEEIKHTLNELNSRIKKLKKRQKPLIKALKILTKGENINE